MCGKAVDDAVFPAHFQWWNPAGCANMQMSEAVDPSAGTIAWARTTACLQCIAVGPLALCSTIAGLACCVCCIPKLVDGPVSVESVKRLFFSCLSGWGFFYLTLFVIIPLVILVAVLFVTIYIACFPVVAIVRIMYGMNPCPDAVVTRLRSFLADTVAANVVATASNASSGSRSGGGGGSIEITAADIEAVMADLEAGRIIE